MKLTIEDINILIEALDAWTISPRKTSMLGGVFFNSMMAACEADGISEEKTKEIIERLNDRGEEKQKAREETATILKAKLIEMRNKLMVELSHEVHL